MVGDVGFLFVLLLFAAATFFLVRLVQERGLPGESGSGWSGPGRDGGFPSRPQRPGPRTPRPSKPKPPTRPTVRGPDDDEDFLRELDRRRLHRDDPDA